MRKRKFKVCKSCEIRKRVVEFYYHPNTGDKLQSWCKECIRDNTQMQRDKRKEA
jgi:hypothetical protein